VPPRIDRVVQDPAGVAAPGEPCRWMMRGLHAATIFAQEMRTSSMTSRWRRGLSWVEN
jgi:hypothetical protein